MGNGSDYWVNNAVEDDSVAVTRKVESRLNKSTRVDGVADFLDVYSQATDDG